MTGVTQVRGKAPRSKASFLPAFKISYGNASSSESCKRSITTKSVCSPRSGRAVFRFIGVAELDKVIKFDTIKTAVAKFKSKLSSVNKASRVGHHGELADMRHEVVQYGIPPATHDCLL